LKPAQLKYFSKLTTLLLTLIKDELAKETTVGAIATSESTTMNIQCAGIQIFKKIAGLLDKIFSDFLQGMRGPNLGLPGTWKH
jgi:hypothetical protein